MEQNSPDDKSKSNVVGDQIMHSASSNKHHNQEQPNVGENAKSEEKVTAVRGDPMDDPAEQAHFRQVVGTFFFYQYEALRDIARIERDFASMPLWQKNMLSFDYRADRIQRLKDCTFENQRFLNRIVSSYQSLFPTEVLPDGSIVMRPQRSSLSDIDKMRSTLHSFVREWSALGASERQESFTPILEEVNDYFQNELGRPAHNPEINDRISVLVPGCGLGRLVFEFARQGYKALGNEFAYFCLLSSNFILNESEEPEQFTIYPFIHNFNNLRSVDDAFREVKIPDTCPMQVMTEPEKFDFAMATGEFMDVFSGQNKEWDCIVTCFFIDTAHNLLDYMQVFNKVLKPGGLWVNIGPLHWHYSEQPGEIQVQLSLEEVEHLIPQFGFEFRKKAMRHTRYTGRINCLLKMEYESFFFSAVKVRDFDPSQGSMGTSLPRQEVNTFSKSAQGDLGKETSQQ